MKVKYPTHDELGFRLFWVPRAHFTEVIRKNGKLTKSQVSKTRGYIAGTKYVRSGSNIRTLFNYELLFVRFYNI